MVEMVLVLLVLEIKVVVAVELVERDCFSAAPFLMVGLRLAAPVSLSGEVVGQLSAAPAGQAPPE